MPRRTIRLLVATLLLTVVPAAAGTRVVLDPATDFSTYRTYAWREAVAAGDRIGPRIRAAADEVLRTKGLRKVGSNEGPDLWIGYTIGSFDVLRAGWVVTAGWWGDLWLVPGGRSSVEAGMLLVLTEAAREQPVFAGRTSLRGNTPQALKVMANRVGKETRKILKKYPGTE